MFFHYKGLQFEAKPSKPDAVYATHLQELLGGAFGEMTVAMQYLFQGWNCRVPGKYKDLILDTATEELAHVEMIATMIARLLEGAPYAAQASAVDGNPMVAAIMGGTNPQQKIVSGLGATPTDSAGESWHGKYIVASGNLMADFMANAAAEAQGRLQTARLYSMTDDPGVKEMLQFNLARDTMHQNQWLAAIEELRADGLEDLPVPSRVTDEENREHAYTLWNLSQGGESGQGRWAKGPTPDGKGEFSFLENPVPLAPEPILPPAPPQLWGTPATPAGTAEGLVQKVKDKIT